MTVEVVAIDLGATSGRVIRASVGRDQLQHEVVHRFPNGPFEDQGHLRWDVSGLFRHIVDGLRHVGRDGFQPQSLGVDSWGVDYGLLKDGELLWEPFHYRDSRTAVGVDAVHRVMNHDQLFMANGLQFLPFNTVYQLAAEDWSGKAGQAEQLLLIPDLIGFWLTGSVYAEATNMSTTGLVGVESGRVVDELVALTGARSSLFPSMVSPGEAVGGVQTKGLSELSGAPVVTVGSHDTASAVVGTPLEGPDCAYISCGTWGLVGVELDHPVLTSEAREANFTNELGVGNKTRFLTNVMGLWLLNETVRELVDKGIVGSLEAAIETSKPFLDRAPLFDVSDPVFLPPGDMPGRIASWFDGRDIEFNEEPAALIAAILQSLADAFAKKVHTVGELTNQEIRQINITGGGSQNAVLCQAVANQSGLPVIAGPVEATALGNLLVQAASAEGSGLNLEAMRNLLRTTSGLIRYEPQPTPGGTTSW